MNNEPVAYFAKDKQGWWAETDKESGVPFYTHPAKTLTEEKCYEVVFDGENYTTKLVEPRLKTLTDQEIIEVHINTPFIDGYLNKNLIDFARAILRKAQEK